MKNKLSLIILISVIALFMFSAVTVFAASHEKAMDNMDIIEKVEFDKLDVESLKFISEDLNGFYQYEVATKDGMLDVYTGFNSLPLKSVENYINKANYAIEQELAINEKKGQDTPDVIEYIYSDRDIQITYLEGTTEDGTYEKEMFITEAITEEDFTDKIGKYANDIELQEDDFISNATISPYAAGNLTDGIGIRAFANQDGQYMTGSFANCPPLNVDKLSNSSLGYYHYFGFTTNSTHTDMGVCYSPAKNGWLPYMLVVQNGEKYMIYSIEPDVTSVGYKLNGLGSSAYGMTSPITITAYKTISGYNNGQNNGAATVRLTTRGTRISPLEQNIMCIAEAGTGQSVSATWRALTTIAGNDSSIPPASNASAPRIEMNFTGVKIGTQSATWGTTTEDRATLVSKGSGYIRGKVNFQ
ncbi:MAG: YrpD family protein [Desulfitobacteriaceae bacterium]|nr:YrpD family protein [Desulfitobacteriaceae bacterium]